MPAQTVSVMRWWSLFAFMGDRRSLSHDLEFFLQNRNLQLQLVDQPVLFDNRVIQDIERVFLVGQADFQFGDAIVHQFSSLALLMVRVVSRVAAHTATGIATKFSTGMLVSRNTPVPRPSERMRLPRL